MLNVGSDMEDYKQMTEKGFIYTGGAWIRPQSRLESLYKNYCQSIDLIFSDAVRTLEIEQRKYQQSNSTDMVGYFYEILKNQKPLGPEFQKVIDDNYWSLLGS